VCPSIGVEISTAQVTLLKTKTAITQSIGTETKACQRNNENRVMLKKKLNFLGESTSDPTILGEKVVT